MSDGEELLTLLRAARDLVVARQAALTQYLEESIKAGEAFRKSLGGEG